MPIMRFLITGGTGFIGRAIVNKLLKDDHEIIILTRGNKKINSKVLAINNLDNISSNTRINVIINLAGAPIDRLWTKRYKAELIESRLSVTRNLLKLTDKLIIKPELLVNASAIGYYGVSNHNEQVVYEDSTCNDSFTHELCTKWEETAQEIKVYGVRLCIARLGIVLGSTGGIVKKMFSSFKYGLGSVFGDGKQYMSWIALEDVIRVFEFFVNDVHTEGPYNLTSINPVTNEEFVTVFAKELNSSLRFRIPESLIKIIFGQMGEELLLNGKCIYPRRLEDSEFTFLHSNLTYCLKNILTEF
jgi:uncharacterized protein (TIGR01777 family)